MLTFGAWFVAEPSGEPFTAKLFTGHRITRRVALPVTLLMTTLTKPTVRTALFASVPEVTRRTVAFPVCSTHSTVCTFAAVEWGYW